MNQIPNQPLKSNHLGIILGIAYIQTALALSCSLTPYATYLPAPLLPSLKTAYLAEGSTLRGNDLAAAAPCKCCGGEAQLPHRNCANMDCNKLFLACPTCQVVSTFVGNSWVHHDYHALS